MEKFSDLIMSPLPVLVDFFAEWCGPCKAMKPVLEDLKKEKGDSLRVVKVDIDKHADLANQYQIQSVPTLIIFKKGELMWRGSGMRPLSELKDTVERFL